MLGDELVVTMPGCFLDGRYGVWTGRTKPFEQRRSFVLPKAYEVEFFTGELDILWLPEENLSWL